MAQRTYGIQSYREVQIRSDTGANWASKNPILDLGEPGWDETNEIMKVGNGVDRWADLASFAGNGAPGSDGSSILSGSGAPSGGTGVDGDFYIDEDVWDLYGPKAAGSWALATSLVGPPGVADTYVHTEASPSTSWTINHNLGRRVSVELTTLGGVEIIADVQHTSTDQAIASFTAPTAGYAIVG